MYSVLAKTNNAKEGGALVNDIANWLYKKIDGAYSMKRMSNSVEIMMDVYYHMKPVRKPVGGYEQSDLNTMTLRIDITTYSNKIRINLIEISPEERTLGHIVIDESKLREIEFARMYSLDRVKNILNRLFKDYEFIF